jgi:hypothetical protein
VARLSQAQLERAVGGAAVLVELLDFDGDGVADSGLVSEILDEVDSEANSYIGLAIDLSDTTIDTAPALLRKEQDCAVYLCWLRGTQAHVIPEAAKLAREDAIRWYGDVRDRRAGLGLASRPTTSQQVQQVLADEGDPYYAEPSGYETPRRRFDGWA